MKTISNSVIDTQFNRQDMFISYEDEQISNQKVEYAKKKV
jgi:hypothetical protein